MIDEEDLEACLEDMLHHGGESMFNALMATGLEAGLDESDIEARFQQFCEDLL